MEIVEKISAGLLAIKEQKPLVHHLTNYVTVNDCANIVLAIGASPVMADDLEEVEEMVALAKALVLNIGTLNSRTVGSMLAAGKKAKALGLPVILDPVGVGATKLRTKTALAIMREVQPDVIRGNLSEIKILGGEAAAIKGVDSADQSHLAEIKSLAVTLALKLGAVIAITGKTDVVTNGQKTYAIDNGHPLLAQITGTGCMATSLAGAYCAALNERDYLAGAAGGIMTMGLAGEMALSVVGGQQSGVREKNRLPLTPDDRQLTTGIGTYKCRLFDAVFNLTPAQIKEGAKIYAC